MSKMRRLWLAGLLLSLVLAGGVIWAQVKAPVPTDSTGEYFVVETRHRLYPNFSQVDTVTVDEPFYIGEDEMKAVVIKFNPHLGITADGTALQMSDTLYNPAIRVRVTQADSLVQESWAFLGGGAPHFRRESMLAFKLLDFKVGDEYAMPPLRK